MAHMSTLTTKALAYHVREIHFRTRRWDTDVMRGAHNVAARRTPMRSAILSVPVSDTPRAHRIRRPQRHTAYVSGTRSMRQVRDRRGVQHVHVGPTARPQHPHRSIADLPAQPPSRRPTWPLGPPPSHSSASATSPHRTPSTTCTTTSSCSWSPAPPSLPHPTGSGGRGLTAHSIDARRPRAIAPVSTADTRARVVGQWVSTAIVR